MPIDENSTTGGHINSGVQPTSDSSVPPKEKKEKEELTPRQIDFLRFYNNPKSETFGNALQSALKAGYSQEYSESITTKSLDWVAENVGRRKRLLTKAEKTLEETLDMPIEVIKLERHGEYSEEIVKTEPALIKIKQDTAKFIAETVGKDEGYSKRTELTGKEGKDLIPDEISKEKADEVIKQYLNGNSGNIKQPEQEADKSPIPIQPQE